MNDPDIKEAVGPGNAPAAAPAPAPPFCVEPEPLTLFSIVRSHGADAKLPSIASCSFLLNISSPVDVCNLDDQPCSPFAFIYPTSKRHTLEKTL